MTNYVATAPMIKRYVDALRELAYTGHISAETNALLDDLVLAEKYDHPCVEGFRI